MAIVSDCVCIDILVILVTTVVGLITYYKWAFNYWKRRNMPCAEYSFPFGSLDNPMWNPESIREQTMKYYETCKRESQKHTGMFVFSIPFYVPIDPEYIKNMLTRDFNHFVNHGAYYNEKVDPLSAHLFTLGGAKWRNIRVKLTPTFTSGKMKMMFPILTECADQVSLFMAKIEHEPINIKDVLSRFTTDVIGSCVLGLKCNSFEDPNTQFRKHLNRALTYTNFENLKFFFGFAVPGLCRFFGMHITPKEVTKFIMGVIEETAEFREKNKFVRKDLMQLLLDLKNNIKNGEGEQQHDGKTLTMDELAAQAYIFLLGGYETSSTTMTLALFELSLNHHIQQKVREEINSVLAKHDGNITYEAIMEMKYMGQVIDETLRKYPPLPVLNRKCTADYKVPGTDLTVEKGTSVIIPVVGLHHDEKYFPNPEKFDPERFSDENKSKIIPFTYLPFGEGPRLCIGLRFGIMQVKVGLTVLLRDYIFTFNTKTKTPVKFDPAVWVSSILGVIWLNVERVKQ